MKASLAIKILLGVVAAVTVFHLCILLKIIPYEITWGGRLTNDTERIKKLKQNRNDSHFLNSILQSLN